jgi:hypothetical protein
MASKLTSKINLDALGIGASVLCLIHCVVFPVLFTTLPLLGLELLENHTLEHFLMGASFLIGYFALIRGYAKHHRKIGPLLVFTFGFAVLVAGHYTLPHEFHAPGIVIGASSIVIAHVWNLKAHRACKVCHGANAVDA